MIIFKFVNLKNKLNELIESVLICSNNYNIVFIFKLKNQKFKL